MVLRHGAGLAGADEGLPIRGAPPTRCDRLNRIGWLLGPLPGPFSMIGAPVTHHTIAVQQAEQILLGRARAG
jgi:hypothetical protein